MYTCTEMYGCLYTYGHVNTFIMHIKMNGIDSQPRKVDLTHAHSNNKQCCEYFTHNNETCIFPIKPALWQ